jgi:hypothetical protein
MASIDFPTFVVAPEARGRGYEVSSAERLAGSWTLDLAMIMLAWSQLLIDEAFAAAIPIGNGGVLVCRGRFIRQLPSGDAVAVLLGVVVSNEQLAQIGYRTDQLAASLPQPAEDTAFGQSPHRYAPGAGAAEAALWEDLQLGWYDRYVECVGECDRMELLRVAMDSILPVSQRARIRSWATTDTLPARGAIDLMGQAQLLFGTQPERAPERFLAAQVRGSRAGDGGVIHEVTHVEQAVAPESFDAYNDMLALAARQGTMAGDAPELAWSVQLAPLAPDALAEKLALDLAGKQKLSATLRLLEAMLDHRRPAIRAGGEAAALKVLERLAQRAPLTDKVLPLIGKLGGNPALFGRVLGHRPLKHQNTHVIVALAATASHALRTGQHAESPAGTAMSAFAVELAELAAPDDKLIECALTIGQSWPDDSLGEIADMLTTDTATAFAKRDAPAFRGLVGRLMRGGFLDVSRMKDRAHATQRVGAALAALDCLAQ